MLPPPVTASVPKPSPRWNRARVTLAACTLVVLAVFAAAYVFDTDGTKGPAAEPAAKETETPSPEVKSAEFAEWYKPLDELKSGFAVWMEKVVKFQPKAPQLKPTKGMANVTNLADYDGYGLPAEAKVLLEKNGFVVVPSVHAEYFKLYESNRYQYNPNFVTTDAMLHEYHVLFDHLLENVERGALIGEAELMTGGMLEASGNQYAKFKGTPWENAAKRNFAFFAVAKRLLDPEAALPPEVKDLAERELALIGAHAGLDASPIMNLGASPSVAIDSPAGTLDLEALKEDYSQYVPRGHYDKDERLARYFKAMMWYGRMTFRLKEADETRSALLMTLALDQGKNALRWNRIYEPTVFFVGKSDDITYLQVKAIVEAIYGADPDVSDEAKFLALREELRKLDPPKVNSIPIFNAAIQPDREREIKGFRFMGQRFTVDAGIMQKLVDRDVPTRMLPKGLDVPAALGSEEAYGLLKAMGETAYPNYDKNMSALQEHLASEPESTWTQNLYWGWMHALRALVDPPQEGYPWFMRNSAWTRKQLVTFLGSWTELKHDTILYAKQVYAELGGGPGPDAKDDRGYVEPNPKLYARLAALMRMTREGLEERGMLSPGDKDSLERMEKLAGDLQGISIKELQGEALSDAEHETIRSFGGQLEHIWLETNRENIAKSGMSERDYLDENPAPVVADIATDPNGTVLEEGTGYGWTIYALVPVDGKLRVASGVVYSHYEFPWPIDDRLTDKRWREMLGGGGAKVPPTHAWTGAFVARP